MTWPLHPAHLAANRACGARIDEIQKEFIFYSFFGFLIASAVTSNVISTKFLMFQFSHLKKKPTFFRLHSITFSSQLNSFINFMVNFTSEHGGENVNDVPLL